MKVLSEARQPEVDFLYLWAVVLPNVWASLLYNRKDTQQYNLGSVQACQIYIICESAAPLQSTSEAKEWETHG